MASGRILYSGNLVRGFYVGDILLKDGVRKIDGGWEEK